MFLNVFFICKLMFLTFYGIGRRPAAYCVGSGPTSWLLWYASLCHVFYVFEQILIFSMFLLQYFFKRLLTIFSKNVQKHFWNHRNGLLRHSCGSLRS